MAVLSISGSTEQVNELKEKIKQVQAEKGCNQMKALLYIIANGGNSIDIDNAELENLRLAVEKLTEDYNKELLKSQTLLAQNETLKQQIKDMPKEAVSDNVRNWLIPPKMGAVVLELMKNNTEPYAAINTPEQACDYLLMPYWRKGVFIASEEEINNYIAAIQ